MQIPDPQLLGRLQTLLEVPFWKHADFWIESILGVAGVLVSYMAYRQAEAAKQEAKKATTAAIEAGRTVKLQTMSIDLTEVSQKLDRVEPGIKFSDAKEMFNETSRKLHRVMAPFEDHAELRTPIEAVKAALDATHESLKLVRPSDATKEAVAPDAVYNGVEDSFATVNSCVARLLGMIEKQTVEKQD